MKIILKQSITKKIDEELKKLTDRGIVLCIIDYIILSKEEYDQLCLEGNATGAMRMRYKGIPIHIEK